MFSDEREDRREVIYYSIGDLSSRGGISDPDSVGVDFIGRRSLSIGADVFRRSASLEEYEGKYV